MAMTVAEIRERLQAADELEFAALERALRADSRKGVKAAVESARKHLDAQARESARIDALYAFDRSQCDDPTAVVVGLDEVGRGAVAGPLAVGAVVLDPQSRVAGINDSKKLTPEMREATACVIRSSAVAWAVHYVEPAVIDCNGMSAALKAAFAGALADIEAQGVVPEVVLIDGNPLGLDPREVNVVKGDAQSASIGAASIVAKVERDTLMRKLSDMYPAYGLHENKGYGSPQHIEAIRTHGISDIHRASFCKSFMQETLF